MLDQIYLMFFDNLYTIGYEVAYSLKKKEYDVKHYTITTLYRPK